MESTTTTTDHAAMRSIADAMRDAATTASEHAAEARQSASEARPKGSGGYLAHGLRPFVCAGLRRRFRDRVYCPIGAPGEPGDEWVARRRASSR